MPQSLANVLVHIVFSTKDRRAYFQDRVFRAEMHRYLAEVSNRLDCPAIEVGGVEDHVHLLGAQARTITLADWIKETKRITSIWIKERRPDLGDFHWQGGYGAFSVSQSQIEHVMRYIRDQETHHRTMTYQDELRLLLRKHKIEFDERYVWD
jgi:REP element-mobilizing transposase RayT